MGLENRLLATLPDAVLHRWRRALVVREFKRGQSLDLRGRGGEVCFPISCVIAIYARPSFGQRSFLRFVGTHFAAGLVDMMAAEGVVFDGVVCGSGYALVMPSDLVLRSIGDPALSGRAQSIAMARTMKGGLVIAQCLGSHTAKQRLARLLLQAHDCFGAERPITLTQQALAEMLMARRETVAGILGPWLHDGTITSRRSAIELRDLDALRRASCGCYAWVQRSYVDEFELWRSIRWHEP